MSTGIEREIAAARRACGATDEEISELQRVAEHLGHGEPPAQGGYATGGYVGPPGPPLLAGCVIPGAPLALGPDECLVNTADVRAGRFVCSRPDHPTATSGCAPARGDV